MTPKTQNNIIYPNKPMPSPSTPHKTRMFNLLTTKYQLKTIGLSKTVNIPTDIQGRLLSNIIY
jgi:hypothetical protein